MRNPWPRMMIRYHIRSKILVWGLCIVVVSTVLAAVLSRAIGPELAHLLGSEDVSLFVLLFGEILIPVLFMVFAMLLIMTSSRSLIDRVLDLSLAAKEIARGNFEVRVSERDRHDEVYQLAMDFNRMAAELQRNEYLRKDFINNVSHEMKTPLAVIGGYVNLLQQEDCSREESLEYLAVISREISRLRGICFDMLEIARLDNCAILENCTSFRLDEQLRQVIVMLQSRWEDERIQLELELPEAVCFGNEGLLEQVWVNLLDNAIKFTEPGGRIGVCLQEDGQTATVAISDSGCGMDPDTQERIFEQFFQGEHSRSEEGSGLGLPLVKRIIELHHGEILVESDPGWGSTFTVRLPMAPPELPPAR